MNRAGWIVTACFLPGLISPAMAYEHHESLVDFNEYSNRVVLDSKIENKPYFLLFSAEWCYWCHEFADNTLVRKDVTDYLNQHFVNVFIDVDIHQSAYVKYQAQGVPYNVFLNPDGTLYYKYTGTLYGDDFLDVIREVAAEVGVGKYALGMESSRIEYQPPVRRNNQALADLPGYFTENVMDNFDPEEFGLGNGKKTIQPRTFLYLLEQTDANAREQAIEWVSKTVERAIERIYDPVEGGFFRYAETRNWQIPHYEKLADLNAATVLLLYRLNRAQPSEAFKQAADTTLAYLTSTLYDDETGVFLSFQIADIDYYLLSEEYRKEASPPKVMDKVFTGRLAATLRQLLPIDDFAGDDVLARKTRNSVDFLARMIMSDEGLNRYFMLDSKQWFSQGELSDYAHVASLFTDAAVHYQDARYHAVASKAIRSAILKFYDTDKGIFIDPGVDNSNVEYLLEMNGLMATAIVKSGNQDPANQEIVESLITYFSQVSEVLEERFWDAVEWDFAEAYVPYLRVVETGYGQL